MGFSVVDDQDKPKLMQDLNDHQRNRNETYLIETGTKTVFYAKITTQSNLQISLTNIQHMVWTEFKSS